MGARLRGRLDPRFVSTSKPRFESLQQLSGHRRIEYRTTCGVRWSPTVGARTLAVRFHARRRQSSPTPCVPCESIMRLFKMPRSHDPAARPTSCVIDTDKRPDIHRCLLAVQPMHHEKRARALHEHGAQHRGAAFKKSRKNPGNVLFTTRLARSQNILDSRIKSLNNQAGTFFNRL